MYKAPFERTSRLGPFQFNFPHRSLEIKNHMPDRFLRPWSSEEHSGYFVVRDKNGHRRLRTFIMKIMRCGGRQQKLLSKDQARRISVNIAKLPELLSK